MAQAHILIPYNSWACCGDQSTSQNPEASYIQHVVAETKLYRLLITIFKYKMFPEATGLYFETGNIFSLHFCFTIKCLIPLTCPEQINIRMILFILFNMWGRITWSPLSGMCWNPIYHLNLDFHKLTLTIALIGLNWQCRIKIMNIISSVLVGIISSDTSNYNFTSRMMSCFI